MTRLDKLEKFLKIAKEYKAPSRMLRRGSRDSSEDTAVSDLQNRLIELGYDLPRFGADGIFGRETYNAVIDFQRASGLTEDGIAGPNTFGKLYSASAASKPIINVDRVSKIREISNQAGRNCFSDKGSKLSAKGLYSRLYASLKNRNLCIAMVANAKHESRLDSGIAGDCGSYAKERSNRSICIEGKGLCCSYGLWQYNICTKTSMGTRFLEYYGVGDKDDEEKIAYLTDADKQIEYMIYELKAGYSGEIQKKKTIREWTEWFVVNIERPANPGGAASKRIPTALEIAKSIPEEDGPDRMIS